MVWLDNHIVYVYGLCQHLDGYVLNVRTRCVNIKTVSRCRQMQRATPTMTSTMRATTTWRQMILWSQRPASNGMAFVRRITGLLMACLTTSRDHVFGKNSPLCRPAEVQTRAASSLLTFRRETKSHLFRQSFGWWKSGSVSADRAYE